MTATAPKVPVPIRRMALANVKSGRLEMPLRVLAYGVEGVGKSTFASGAPRPIYLGADAGTATLDVARLPEPATWEEALDGVRLLEKEKHDYETLVIDPVNWLEPLCWEAVTGGTKSIEDFGGGYGRGYAAALDRWRLMVSALERVWSIRKMHVIMLAHCHVKSFNDPTGPAYDRFELAMHAKSAGLLKQWCDYVLFMRHESMGKIDPQTKKAKGISTGARVAHTQWSAAYDAKTRVRLPEELPLSWDAFFEAVRGQSAKADELKKAIGVLLEQLGDADVMKRATAMVSAAKDDADRLAEIENGLRMKIGQKESA